ncbi:transposable element Tc1 transposase [Trichonephila clavipes]|uniref:Transposable element Tc1 transposase n=1 Tax=Trichonephila clavipes TaxID=2585209 RepID=A0A8X6WGU4_TRICX|nr:transposable element Tc1 transposase [Trichonephila clavipes]
MDDNARPYRTLAVEELLYNEDIFRRDWPAYSPDLNPIEHVWDALGRRIAARLHHPENTQQLKQMLIEEWALLPQEMLHQLVLSPYDVIYGQSADGKKFYHQEGPGLEFVDREGDYVQAGLGAEKDYFKIVNGHLILITPPGITFDDLNYSEHALIEAETLSQLGYALKFPRLEAPSCSFQQLAVSTGFCRPRATWSVTDWRRVIFSDESRFSLSADDHRTRVWRRTGQRSDPAFIVERHTAISQDVTVWGAISWDTRSSLVVLQGTLTARRYVDDILTPIVLPMLSSRPGAIYQQDNARPHTARLSQQCLQGYDVLPWPARSPDLSPIEHVWGRWEGNCSRPEIQEN